MCVFCKIANKEIPNYTIFENDDVLAMLDISQATKGHTLVIPKKHYDNIFEVPEKTLLEMTKVVKLICDNYKKVIPNLKGINILNNNGEKAGQTVNHFHIHIIPRYEDDDIKDISFTDHNSETDFTSLVNQLKIK